MANLDDIEESLNKNPKKKLEIISDEKPKVQGFKRRHWLTEDSINDDLVKQVNGNSPNEKKVVQTAVISSQLLAVRNDHDTVYNKGSINTVYKPLLISLVDLRSNPLKLAKYFYENTKKNTPEKTTTRVTQTEIMKTLAISKDSARTALRFLLKNKMVERIGFQPGKLGWSKYQLQDELFIEINSAYDKGAIKPLIDMTHVDLSKSYKVNDSENSEKSSDHYYDWDHIDISLLEHIGFNKNHIKQLKLKNSPEIVQESINHFAYGLDNNPKAKNYADPIAVLMGVLIKGSSWTEAKYRSPQEISLEKMVESKKLERKRLEILEKELLQEEFEEWYKNLTSVEIAELTKNKIASNLSLVMQQKATKGFLFETFIESKHK